MAVPQGLYSQDRDPVTRLTKRQRQVAEMLKAGRSQLDIATELGVSRQRVRQIVEDILRRGVMLPGSIKPPPPRG